jgi:hypothetical protein
VPSLYSTKPVESWKIPTQVVAYYKYRLSDFRDECGGPDFQHDGNQRRVSPRGFQIAQVRWTQLSQQRSVDLKMKRALACVLAIAGWYLLYPPASLKNDPDSPASLSKWEIDGSYSTAADCDAAYRDDLNSMVGLRQNSNDFLQTQAGRCIASDDPRLAK